MSLAKKQPVNKTNKQIATLVQKIVLIVVVQLIIFGAFILVDRGFLTSLRLYVVIVISISMVTVIITHFYTLKLDQEEEPKSILDDTDFAG
ncbi:MAG: hypothetical protein ACTSUE_14565 [Promethearchaeota archaeon]